MSIFPSVMLVCNGLILSGDGLTLHEDLLQWQKVLSVRKRIWFSCSDKTPLEWYAAISDVPPAILLAAQSGNIPVDAKQCWAASPYHAQLGRDTVRVMPEGALPWCEEDSLWLCDALNPLLKEEGMYLLHAGAALLLACDEPMHVRPQSFAMIAGKMLPSRHPEGEDGGRLMRLISEIQMALHGKQAPQRSGQPDIHGLWFWGGCSWPTRMPETMSTVATRNPFLQAVAKGKDAKMMITEAERMGDLVKQGEALPKKVVLAGEGYAMLLSKSLLPGFGKASWIPGSAKAESELLFVLRSAA